MKAISKTIAVPIGVTRGIKPGLDLVCVCYNTNLEIDSIKKLREEVDNNKFITIKEIDEKVNRILKYKN